MGYRISKYCSSSAKLKSCDDILHYDTNWIILVRMKHDVTSTWRTHFDRLEGAFAPSTLRAYFADVQHFETWCNAAGVSAFTVSNDDLCDYLKADGLDSAPATVRRRLYAIRKVHRLLRLPDPTLDEAVNITIRRIKRRTLCRPKQAKGLTSEYLAQFLAVQPDTPWGWRNRAMLSLGYDLLTRRS